MDGRDEVVWLAFVQAENIYRTAMADLRKVDLVEVLREGLNRLPWRRPALAVLGSSGPEISSQLLPELFELASVSHSLIGEVRKCILRVPGELLKPQIAVHVERLTADRQSDYEAYRRIAELLVIMKDWELLDYLVNAASMSSDVDIREVAADFDGVRTTDRRD
ncbi:hypothetical protein ACFOWZ_33475 [Lentzea rhizosphaerae]|jgi:hypothetical protein|uniref:Uncharacterized protein n=1 Tax=Lentzea rhizosphaerae TaxID=2041025 RepID=A0ABV8C349_9PSEU